MRARKRSGSTCARGNSRALARIPAMAANDPGVDPQRRAHARDVHQQTAERRSADVGGGERDVE